MKHSIKKDFPFYVLVIVVALTVIDVFFDNEKSLLLKHYLGIGSVLVCLLLYFVSYKTYKYLWLFILILGSLNLVYFSNPVNSFTFSFKALNKYELNTFSIQTIPFLLLIIEIILNRKSLIKLYYGF